MGRLRMEAWIEICRLWSDAARRNVASVWRRGLKFFYAYQLNVAYRRLRMEAWIEIGWIEKEDGQNESPPYGGVD